MHHNIFPKQQAHLLLGVFRAPGEKESLLFLDPPNLIGMQPRQLCALLA